MRSTVRESCTTWRFCLRPAILQFRAFFLLQAKNVQGTSILINCLNDYTW